MNGLRSDNNKNVLYRQFSGLRFVWNITRRWIERNGGEWWWCNEGGSEGEERGRVLGEQWKEEVIPADSLQCWNMHSLSTVGASKMLTEIVNVWVDGRAHVATAVRRSDVGLWGSAVMRHWARASLHDVVGRVWLMAHNYFRFDSVVRFFFFF